MTRHGRKPDETTLTVWQVIELARHADRPYSLDYVRRLAPDFVELHGDRLSGDDPALVGAILQVFDKYLRVAFAFGYSYKQFVADSLRVLFGGG